MWPSGDRLISPLTRTLIPALIALVSAAVAAAETVDVNVANLPHGTMMTLEMEVNLAACVPAGLESLANQASIDGDNLVAPIPSNVTMLSVDAAAVLTLGVADTPDPVAPGQALSYAFDYGNSGNQAASDVTLAVMIPDHTTYNAGASTSGWSCGGGMAGDTCSFSVAGDVSCGDADQVVLAFTVDSPVPAGVAMIELVTATVSAQGDATGDSTTASTVLDAAPDLAVSKTPTGLPVGPGGSLTFMVDYANNGSQSATGVVLTETVPVATTYGGAAGWACLPDTSAGSTCTSPIGALAAGGNGSTSFTVMVDDPLGAGVESTDNTISIADDGANGLDLDTVDNQATVPVTLTAAPDLVLAKSDGGATVVAGATVIYDLTYDNVGSQDAAGVVMTETVPQYGTFAPGSSSPGWACAPDATAGSTCSLNLGAVAVGDGAMVSFAVTADLQVPAGVAEIANSASIADDGSGGADATPEDNLASDSTPLDAAPDLWVTKGDGGIVPQPGAELSYTLDYGNDGSQGATGVELGETVPTGTTFVAGSSTAGWVCVPDATAGSTCSLAVGGLVVGGSGGATFAVQLDDPLPVGLAELSNTVTIADDGANGVDLDLADNSDTLVTTLDSDPPTITAVTSVGPPVDGFLDECDDVRTGVRAVDVTFSEAMADPPGDGDANDVTNPANYLLLSAGNDEDLATTGCGTVFGDDASVPLVVTYDGGSNLASLDAGGPLAGALYRLIACGTTTLTDQAGNPLDGDADGTGGDDFVRTFRLDPGNAFVNGHLDCDADGWDLTSATPGEIGWSLDDSASSNLSGSLQVQQLGVNTTYEVGQCVELYGPGHLQMAVAARIDAAVGIGVTLRCTFYPAAACSGAAISTQSATQFTAPTGGLWEPIATVVDAPAGSASARCAVAIGVPGGSNFTLGLDRLFLDDGSRLFRDGFESGDVTAWTLSVGGAP